MKLFKSKTIQHDELASRVAYTQIMKHAEEESWQ